MNAVSGISRLLMAASLDLVGGCISNSDCDGDDDCAALNDTCQVGRCVDDDDDGEFACAPFDRMDGTDCTLEGDESGTCVGGECESGTAGTGGMAGTGGAGGMSALSVVDAYVTPPLPTGVTAHFTGVTQFLLAELSSEQAVLKVTCTGSSCPNSFNASTTLGDPPLAEVQLSLFLPEDEYVLGLTATLDGMESAVRELTVELRPGVGDLRCEESTNGLAGAAEVRWFGLQLQTSGGQPIANADYYLYDRTASGQGWGEYQTLNDADKLVLSGSSSELSSSHNFQAIAVDRTFTLPTAAAREFRYGEVLSPTFPLGCVRCSIGAGGSCDIIPLE
jgi:hypothetical protein